MTKTRFSVLLAALLVLSLPALVNAHGGAHKKGPERIKLSPLGQVKTGPYGQGAAEIVAYDADTQRAYVVNGFSKAIDVISIAKPESPSKVFDIKLMRHGSPTSVAVKNGLVAVAVQGESRQTAGAIVVFNLEGTYLNSFTAGALPDMVTFTPDGKRILSANEGQPSNDYENDPEGSITIVTLDDNRKPGTLESSDIATLSQNAVQQVSFKEFNNATLDSSVRIFGQNATVAQDLEPEFIAVSADAKTAWITLQENNALAILDIENAQITQIVGLGFKSYNTTENGIDASDKDNEINIQARPVFGMYQPDSVASYQIDGQHYIVTANEGDARDYNGYSEVKRVKKANLSDALIKAHPDIISDQNLGRLKISTATGDLDGDGKLDQLYSYGARSFSIWDAQGKQIFDSGADFANITARDYPMLFNLNDSLSDDRGAEPEALAIGQVGKSVYAFIGLEGTSGVMVYNISKPANAFYVDYLTTKSPHLAENDPNAGDIAPESLVFVSAEQSPNGKALLISANEVSGTMAIYQVEPAANRAH